VKKEWQFEHRTELAAPAGDVWARVVSADGINDEMRPWMTMSVPRRAEGITIDNLAVGTPIGRAWLRLFGVLPFDYDHLTITELDPGHRFREESTMLTMRRWVHDRTIVSTDTGATVIDRVILGPRLPMLLMGPVLARVVRAFFGHRHRRLARHFDSIAR